MLISKMQSVFGGLDFCHYGAGKIWTNGSEWETLSLIYIMFLISGLDASFLGEAWWSIA